MSYCYKTRLYLPYYIHGRLQQVSSRGRYWWEDSHWYLASEGHTLLLGLLSVSLYLVSRTQAAFPRSGPSAMVFVW